MKKFFAICAVALGSVSGHASAADLSYNRFDQQYDWSGFYAGAHAGYGWIKGADSFGSSDRFDGFLGSAHAGYIYMFQQFLFGVEIDGSLLDINGTTNLGNKEEAKWLASARLRAGFTHDRFLVFATGGISAAGVEFTNPEPA
ncbi:outer membrane protein [Stappia sp. ES.058]|uniref:outer membrane protein n=1 Tax=Stappia sp. ES.058 TaxID=1881061 RepID=UPI000B814605|nr:outer membrane beta-barrel protein [Stappia sp. ES.058]